MQENFKHILITTDFSPTGDHAIGHAFRIAADHRAEVILCHIVDVVPPPNPLYAHYYPTESFQPERAVEEARQALLKRVPRAGTLAQVPYKTVVVEGSAVDEILRVATDEHADLVVIATHGRTGVKHIVLGSVAERVIRHTTCPVLVVR
jgi:universal stress protein A